MSDILLISTLILYILMILIGHKAVNGLGEMKRSLRQFSIFMLDKAPAGVIDMFSRKQGAGARTWIINGAAWATLAATVGFLEIWLRYQPTALDSFSSIGWSYNSEVMSGFAESTLIFGFLFMTLIGACLHIFARSNDGKLGSEANASLMAMMWSGLLTFILVIVPLLIKFELLGDYTGWKVLFFPAVFQIGAAMILGGLLINQLLALGEREPGTPLSVSSWLVILGYVAAIWAFAIRGAFIAMLGDSTIDLAFGNLISFHSIIASEAASTVWLADRVVGGWFPVALMLAVAYHVIPSISASPIWSRSLSYASYTLLFVSVPVLTMSDAELDDDTLLSMAAVLVVVGLVPLLAASSNLIATMQGRWERVVATPGGAASASAILLLPILAVMGFFSSLDEINGAHHMPGVQSSVDHGILWLVGGLLSLAVWARVFPEVVGRRLASHSKARWSFWLLLAGGLGSTITLLMGDFAGMSLADAGVEDVSSHLGGYNLTAAAIFYATVIGIFVGVVNLTSTLFSDEAVDEEVITSAGATSMTLLPGTTSIRDLVSRGAGVDTELILIIPEEDEEEVATEVGVSAALHTDDGVVMPTPEPVEAAPVESLDAFESELVDLARWLMNSDMTTVDLFQKMDINSDGTISPFEIREGLASLDIADLPPWDVVKLVESMDLDGDGEVNIPELDIHMLRIQNALSAADPGEAEDADDSADEGDEETEEESDDASDDSSDEETPPYESELKAMKKAELVALAEEKGLSTKGTKSDLVTRLLE